MADPESFSLSAPSACRECGTALAANLLSCPGCGRLVYSEELKRLANEAGRAAQPVDALRAWRRAASLLPAGSRQRATVLEKIEALVPLAGTEPISLPAKAPEKPGAPKTPWQRILAALGVSALFLLTKAKLLLLGLTKMGTLLSMAASLGLYWSLWGWKFALGFVLSIYVHEMGHVAMLTRLGVRATAPMFIPGFGAMVRSGETLPTAREVARVALAGPIWGLGAAIVAYALSLAFDSAMMRTIAMWGAGLNLFNLAPVWILDGEKAFRALTQKQRWIAVGAVAVALLISSIMILWVVLIAAVIRALGKDAAEAEDRVALGEFMALVGALSLIVVLTRTGM